MQDGLALCAIIHRYRPDLIDMETLIEEKQVTDNQLAFDLLEKEFNISPVDFDFLSFKSFINFSLFALQPVTTTEDNETYSRETVINYLTQIHDVFRGEIPQSMGSKPSLQEVRAKVGISR